MMRRAKILLVLMLLLSSVSFAVDEECYICDLMAGKPQSQIIMSSDIAEQEITAYLFYENFSAEPSRTAIDNALLFVYVVSADGDTELLKIFTDEEGGAVFDFSSYALIAQEDQIVYNFQMIYCPFCHPEDEGYPCGFDECVAFSGMEVPSSISGATNPVEEVPLAEGASLLPEDEWEREYYLPSSASFTYTPPPPIVPEVPAFCFPILLIFALLAGAMYFSGKNPFAGFNLGTPRMGRHIRYTPGGRGMSVSGKYVAQSIAGGVSEAKSMAKEAKEEKSKTSKMNKAELKDYKAQKKEARKTAAKNQFLNFVSMGTYGSITGASGRVAAGPKGGFTTSSGRGAIQAIKKAPSVFKKAKGSYKAAKIAMKPAAIEGKAIKGKGYGAQVAEQAVRAGGGIISSHIFGSRLSGLMMGFVLNKDITALSQQQAEIELAKEEGQKYADQLDNMVNNEKLTEIQMDGKTYYEMNETVETKDGKITVITTRIDKQALLNGKMDATVAVGKEGYVEVRHFTGEYGINNETGKAGFVTHLSSVTITKGTGSETVSATYSIVGNRLKIEAINFGEDGRGRPITSGENIEFIRSMENQPAEKAATTEFMKTKIDTGVTIGKVAAELAEANYKKEYAIRQKQDIIADIAVHSYYVTNEQLKEQSRQTAEAVDNKLSETKLSDEGKIILSAAEMPGQEDNVKEHYAVVADTEIVNAGTKVLVEKYGGKATKAQTEGAKTLYSMGTELATKNEKTVKADIKKEIMAVDYLTKEEKQEAIKTANDLYSDASKTAKTWNTGANDAANTYNEIHKITKENMKPVYKGQDKELQKAMAYVATTEGISGYYEAEGATKKNKHNHMQDKIAKGTISKSGGKLDKTPEQKFLSTFITEGPYKEAEFKLPPMPEVPKVPEPPKAVEKMTPKQQEKYGKKMKQYNVKMDEYNRAMDNYTKDLQKQLEEFEKKQKELVYGDGADTAVGGALVLTSAIQKGYELPENVYATATEGIENEDPDKWKEAALEGMKEVEEKKKERSKKSKKKMAEDLSEFEM